jgi:hypothetical protein
VGLELGPLSLVSTTEELFEIESSCFGIESRDYGRRGSAARTMRHSFIRKKFALTSPTNGGRSVDVVRSGTQDQRNFNRNGYIKLCLYNTICV